MATWITAQTAKEKHFKPMGAVTSKGYKPVRWNSMSFPFGPVTDSRKKARAELEAECVIPVWVHGEIGSDIEGWDYLFDAADTTAHDDPFVFEGEPANPPPSEFLDAATTFEVPLLSDELDELDPLGDETHVSVYCADNEPGEVQELEDYTIPDTHNAVVATREEAGFKKDTPVDFDLGWWRGLDASDEAHLHATNQVLRQWFDSDEAYQDWLRLTEEPEDLDASDVQSVLLNDDDNLATWDRSTHYTFEDPTDTFTYTGPPFEESILEERDELLEYLEVLQGAGIPEDYTVMVHRQGGPAWVSVEGTFYPVAGYAYEQTPNPVDVAPWRL